MNPGQHFFLFCIPFGDVSTDVSDALRSMHNTVRYLLTAGGLWRWFGNRNS